MILKYSSLHFQIPEGIKKYLQVTNDLKEVSSWKAKIILGNSLSKDKKKGDWDDVGYIFVSPTSNLIVPIARGDEHQTGTELMYWYQSKGLVPQGDFEPVYATNHDYIYKEDKWKVYKKWLALGGENLLVESGGDLYGANYIGTMQDVVDKKGKVSIRKGVVAPFGQKLIASLEELATLSKNIMQKEKFYSVEKLKKNFLVNAKSFLHSFDDIWLPNSKIVSWGKEGLSNDFIEKSIEQITSFEKKGDFNSANKLLFGFNGLKNIIHNRLREFVSNPTSREMDKDGYFKLFGDLNTALQEFNRLGNI